MAAVAESIGFGCTLNIDDGASQAFEQVFNLVDMTPPSETLGTTDSKRLDSPGGVVVKVPTMFTTGTCTVTQQFSSTAYARMEALRAAKTNCNFKFVINGADANLTLTAPGYIKENKYTKIEGDKIEEFETTFEVSAGMTQS